MCSLNNLVAFVTGGASGLGRGTIKHLLDKGARGCFVIDKQPFDYKEDDNLKQLSSKIEYFKGDVTNEDDVKCAFNECKSKFGKIDSIINCAGISMAFRVFNFKTQQPHRLDDFRNVVINNTLGTFNVIRLGLEYLAQNEPDPINKLKGVVINTSGNAAFDGQSGQVAYAASAGAINSMTLPLARDIAEAGIRCVTISTGYFATPLIQSLPQNIQDFLARSATCPKRIGTPYDFALLVESIIINPYLNATVINLDGGLRTVV